MESISHSVIHSSNIFSGKKYVNNKNEDFVIDYFNKLNIIGLFFTGSWCPACEKLGQELIDVYNDANLIQKENGKENIFEIIQVSNEKSETDFIKGISDKPWVHVALNDTFSDYLVAEYKINYLPVLFIITKDRIALTESPRKDISELGIKAHEKWIKAYKAHKERERELSNLHNN